ncbi:glutamate receptor 2.8-like [Lolium rigidum]|uniref:glutamate receptor 2.8-like n=1 Tax=Lolium rigidum TaxID=89674 RepID=UPI001F5C4932|nr:glutamate receptor 2.8-like [Lolium rigidum]
MIKLHPLSRSRIERPTRRSLIFLSLLGLWSTAAAAAAAEAVAASVRVGVVLDLRSEVGRKRRACISMALHDFELKHPSYATRVELYVMDSRGEAATTAHAAEDLIKNVRAHAIIWGPHTLTKEDHVSHLGRQSDHNHIPVISYSSTSPASCTFWIEDPVKASGGHPKFGFTLGSDSITFLNLKTDKRNGANLDCEGPRMKIAVPEKQGFKEFVDTTDPNNITGYSIDIFKASMETLYPIPCYDYSVFQGTYDELVGNVSSGTYAAAVGDVTITAERVTCTDFTMPYTQSGVSMLVLAEDEPNTIRWTFVEPLNWRLWFASLVFFLYTGFALWMIELPRNQEYQGSSLRQCSTALYFVFSTLTFSHGQSIRSPLSKIVVVIWCFVVLILVQSYTASLSSILTAKRLRPFMNDFDQLQRSGDFVGYQTDSFVRSFLLNHKFIESRLRNYTTKEEYANALKLGSKNGGVSAIIDEIPYLTSFLSYRNYKNNFKILGCIYKTPGFGFAFHLGSPLAHNLSIAILNLTGGGSEIEEKWFGRFSPPIGVGTDSDSGPLTLQSFSGLFVITGSISTLMLLISIARRLYAKFTSLGMADYTDVDDDSDPLQNGMGNNPDPDQQPISEVDNDDLQGVRADGQNAQEEAPGPVQHNGTNGGSLPAEHIQIQMGTI